MIKSRAIHFDAVTSTYINIGPAGPPEGRERLPEVFSSNESEEQDISKMSAEKIKQVTDQWPML